MSHVEGLQPLSNKTVPCDSICTTHMIRVCHSYFLSGLPGLCVLPLVRETEIMVGASRHMK